MIVRSYSIDGIALENPMMEWIFRGPSRPLSGLSVRRTALVLPGLPGVLPDPDDALVNLEPPMPTLMVQTPRKHYDALLSLFADGSVMSITDQPHREAPFELLTSSPEGYGNGDEIIDATFTVQLPGVFWRDTATTTKQADLTGASVTVDPWEMSGLVTDAVIRVRGPVSGLTITSRSASIAYSPALPSGSFFRYECATGRAFVTTTDTWSGGTSVGGSVVADGPGDKFAIFPTRIDPLTRAGRITVGTSTRGTGARVEVRGKGAHLAF